MSIRKLCSPLSLCSSAFILSFFMALIFIKSKNYITWRMSLNLGCLSLWIRHNMGVELTCISVGKNGLGEPITCVAPLWMTFSLVPFIKLYFLTDFSYIFSSFIFPFVFHKRFVQGDFEAVSILSFNSCPPQMHLPVKQMRWGGCAQSSVSIDSLGYFSS